MFSHQLCELVTVIFDLPAEIDRSQSHSANEVYIRVNDYDIAIEDSTSVYFNVDVTLSITFPPSDDDPYGFITAKLKNYSGIPLTQDDGNNLASIKDISYREVPVTQTLEKTVIQKDVTFAINVDYDRVTEVIKGIKYNGDKI
ncbi:hypothetical protein [Photobacterium indicum]|uniref:Uncharacterized protein n=1 Tax=Photobacterium indicum TaxID=81447 RepID=A0A2T3LF63_9GAMM|nr:hypothetical protein [Photobacterium indicum]PSV50033.1 hypothetical protein C9J47_05645 [Photobacterium indicum]